MEVVGERANDERREQDDHQREADSSLETPDGEGPQVAHEVFEKPGGRNGDRDHSGDERPEVAALNVLGHDAHDDDGAD
jgi:hypothetical protein